MLGKIATDSGGGAASVESMGASARTLIKRISELSRKTTPNVDALAGVKSDYERIDRDEKPAFFRALLDEVELKPDDVNGLVDGLIAARDEPAVWHKALAEMRAGVESPRLRFWREFIAMPGGLKFLLDLRADVLLATRRAPELDLGPLDQDLIRLFDAWFSGGFLFLEEISLDSPYRQIEILKDRDLVHPMTSLEEMGRRLGRDRRCFALYHRLMPEEPIIFIEVALTRGIIRTIHEIIGQPEQGAAGAAAPDTAMFYSINNTQNGLAGLGLGKTLIFQVVDYLKREQPEIRNFCTLSPLPGFWRRYLKPILEGETDRCQMQTNDLAKLFDKKVKGLLREHHAEIGGDENDDFPKVLLGVFSDTSWAENKPLVGALNKPLTQLAYHYLAEEKSRSGRPIDPVANFHLGNGAQVSPRNVNFGANWSQMGLERSLSLMVNYIYSAQWRSQFRGSMTWLGRLLPGLSKSKTGRPGEP